LRLTRTRARVEAAAAHRVFAAEQGRLRVRAQRVDELVRRGERALVRRLETSRERAGRKRERLEALRWDRQLAARRERVARRVERLHALLRGRVDQRRARLAGMAGRLEGLSPIAVLGRGYALVWDEATGVLLRDAGETELGHELRVRLHRGTVRATVQSKEPE